MRIMLISPSRSDVSDGSKSQTLILLIPENITNFFKFFSGFAPNYPQVIEANAENFVKKLNAVQFFSGLSYVLFFPSALFITVCQNVAVVPHCLCSKSSLLKINSES